MRILLLIAALALTSAAQATNRDDNGCRGNCEQPYDGSDTFNLSEDQAQNQNQAQLQGQSQGQLQGQHQSADATAIAGAIAGASSSSDNTNLVSNRNDVKNSVDVNTSDYNANLNANHNTNVANGGRGGDGGEGGTAIQGQSQSSDNSNSSNNSSSQSTNLTFESTGEATHYNKYGNNVGAIAPNIYSSSACTAGGLSGAASALGVGVSLGGAKQDVQCQVRENARILAGLDVGMAIDYLCKNTKVDIGEVLGAACKYSPPVPTQPIVIPPPAVVSPPIVVDDQVRGK